jgi:hypothetical protein
MQQVEAKAKKDRRHWATGYLDVRLRKYIITSIELQRSRLEQLVHDLIHGGIYDVLVEPLVLQERPRHPSSSPCIVSADEVRSHI